jgi:protein SCO1/2
MRFKFTILFLLSIFLFAACQKAETQTASADAKRFDLKGVVLAVDRANKKATIKHEEIPGYMEAMTMDLPIREDWVWDDLTENSEILAELVVDDAKGEYWLEKIAIVASSSSGKPAPPVNENFAQIGNQIPAFSLVNQDGKKISPKDFAGKALAITFIYSRCPLPEYCILMSKNFSDAAIQLRDNAELKDKIRLLSISFDPATDTPEKLKQYGQGYLGKDAKPDFNVWQLATGTDKQVKEIADFFGLLYEVDQNDKTQFNHSLRTIVVAPDGKVQKIFAGQDWTTAQLLSELQKSLNPASE